MNPQPTSTDANALSVEDRRKNRQRMKMVQRNGEAHVNAAYGVSAVALGLVVESSMGQIVLE